MFESQISAPPVPLQRGGYVGSNGDWETAPAVCEPQVPKVTGGLRVTGLWLLTSTVS